MNTHLLRSARDIALVLIALCAPAACRQLHSDAKDADTSLAVRDSSPIRDKTLRPTGGGVEPAVRLHGMPTYDSVAMRSDTAVSFVAPEPLSMPIVQPGEPDLAVLRRELTVPVAGVPASALHDTYAELRGGTRPHEALDILAPRGTPVLSSASGRVLKLFNSKAGGLMVYAADSSGRFILMYGHLDAYAPGLADGQPLRQGQQIGIVGTTGNAPANTPHLHFAVARAGDLRQWWKGTPVNPFPLLKP